MENLTKAQPADRLNPQALRSFLIGAAWVFLACGWRCEAEDMPQVLPPPPERFDPITARWVTPGGPLLDPARDCVDPDRLEPVTLVGPIPSELAESEEPGMRNDIGGSSTSPSRRFRWATFAIIAVGITALVVGAQIGYCLDPGGCTIGMSGGPIGWVAALVSSGLAIYAARRAILG